MNFLQLTLGLMQSAVMFCMVRMFVQTVNVFC